MSVIKEIAEQESQRQASGVVNELHLYQEGTFLRAYGWSAWLCVRYVQDFKATKRKFKNEDAPYQNRNRAEFAPKPRGLKLETAQFEI